MAVSEELSFIRGAARAGVSQPPLSRQIAKLETELGTRLLDRNKHGVTLTDAGSVFYSGIKRTLVSLDTAVKAALGASKGQVGSLSLGFGGSAAYTFMPRLLRRFRELFPGVELSLHNMPMTSQFEALNENRIEIAFLVSPIGDERIATKVLLRDPLNVALPSGHPLCKRKVIPLAVLKPYDFVVFPRTGGLGIYRKVMELCTKAGFIPTIVQEMAPMESLIGLVGAGVGISIVPSVARTLRIAEVEYRPIQERRAVVSFVMAWRRDDTSPVVRAFVDLVDKWPAAYAKPNTQPKKSVGARATWRGAKRRPR
jgi:LysR family transcriptional regulator, benzoate and cis,cis-muconate-responsive activator of ben and cat genes